MASPRRSASATFDPMAAILGGGESASSEQERVVSGNQEIQETGNTKAPTRRSPRPKTPLALEPTRTITVKVPESVYLQMGTRKLRTRISIQDQAVQAIARDLENES